MENPTVQHFIDRWKNSGAAERANYQLFLTELCDLLGVLGPEPTTPDDSENAYVFERSVTFHHADGSTSTGRIDLYKRGCFVLEAKQGVEKREQEVALSEAGKAKAKVAKKGTATRGSALWDEAMLKARGQAEQYARALPASEGRPPLLIVVDVGHTIEIYSEFRPSFQHPTTTTQATLDTGDIESTAAPTKAKAAGKLAWPKTLAEQAQAVRAALSAIAVPADAITLARTFKGAKTDKIEDILETLASLGQARALRDGRYVAR